MRHLFPSYLLCGFLLAGVLPATTSLIAQDQPAETNSDDEGYRPLFNGQDLSGWVAVNTAPSTWRVEEGMLICSGKPIGELRTERMYQNFVMEVEWRHMVPAGNAGIFIWADDITARGQPFHRGIEVQVLENAYGNTRSHTTHGDIFPIHGATMTPINGRGGSRAFPIENRSRPSPEWNHYRITCLDGNIALEVNGKLVTQGRDCRPKKGYICLESEGGVVHYRNLKLKELPDTPLEPEDIAIANRGYRCLYTGVDFSGWKFAPSADGHWQTRDWVFSYDGQADAAGSVVATSESFDDLGFILDVRFGEAGAPLQLRLRGAQGGLITLDPSAFELGGLLAEGRGWNRIEGTLEGDLLSVSINGQSWLKDRQLEQLPAQGPIEIIATGATDFANPYVRELAVTTEPSQESP